MHTFLLTFDAEDYISPESTLFLKPFLESLKRYEFKALFFLTGHMAEKLKEHTDIVELLKEHEIGYHSSSHSVHPTIFEFTDIENYEEAYKGALRRETSHINPLNGTIEGIGGIQAVQSLFPNKKIQAYRAPGLCWSPPHSEALRDLGLKFDFSTNISSIPISYRGIVFYPLPTLKEWYGYLRTFKGVLSTVGYVKFYQRFLSSILTKKITVMIVHPAKFVCEDEWDSIYYAGNPKNLTCSIPRSALEIKSIFSGFESFLKKVKTYEKNGSLTANWKLIDSAENYVVKQNNTERVYEDSVAWPKKFFSYEPKYLNAHFVEFFLDVS